MALMIATLLVGILLGSLLVYSIYKNKQIKIQEIDYTQKTKLEKEIAETKEELSLLRQQTDQIVNEYYESELEKANLK